MRRFHSPAFSGCQATAHEGFAHIAHDGFNIGKIEIDQARNHDEVGNTADRLLEYVVHHEKKRR